MRLFTVAEVEKLIPRLEFLMDRLQRADRTLRAEIALIARAGEPRVHERNAARLLEAYPRLRELTEQLRGCMREIDQCGGQLKGVELGLVDFPAEIEGQVSLLCWQYGEKRVGYYHSEEAGFSGRKPLPGAADADPPLQ